MAAPMSAAAEGEAAAAGLQRAVEGLQLLLGRGAGTGALPAPRPSEPPESLRLGLAALEERLARDAQWDALRATRAEVALEAAGLDGGPEAPWAAACQALLLLLCLKRGLDRAAAATPGARPGEAPALRPDALSATQEGAVRAGVQLAVALGLRPYLLPGVGQAGRDAPPPGAPRRLHATCTALTEAAKHPALGRLILARHLGDLLAGLCQLGFHPARRAGAETQLSVAGQPSGSLQGLTEEERSHCKDALQALLDRAYQPLVVQELLLLQGGPRRGSHPSKQNKERGRAPAPAWLQRLCGHLLSGRLLRPGGVQAVIRGILEAAGAVGGNSAEAVAADWQKCEAIAKILSSCPQQSLSLEDYCQQICPQVLQLFLIQDELTMRQFQPVATATVLTLVRQHPQEAEKHLLRPLLEPLLHCLEGAEGLLEDLPAGTVLVQEEELSGCLETLYKVCVVGDEPSPCLLGSLQLVLGAIFSLWCFTKQNVSFLRTPCQEVLLWFLEKSERQASLGALEGLAQLRGTLRPLHPLCQFQAASAGGVVATVRGALRDEDEALYQKISSEQWQLEQLVDLLSHCRSAGLAGDFFICCLKELTQIASEKDPAPPSQGAPLDLEQQTKQLQVLRLVAVLTEGISDSLLTDVRQVVEFVAATLQRARVSLPGAFVGAVEAQTLHMAMGLVAAMLGGAMQLKSEDFATLKQLVPLLEEVSRLHPERAIQDLAAGLVIAIRTHAAFTPEAVSAAACDALGRRAGQARAAAHANPPSGRPGPAAPLPQKPPRGAESPAEESSGSCPAKNLQELLLGAYDPDIPTRAAALRCLSRMIKRRDPGALKMREKLLKVFVENVEHQDAFVYLSAIQGVALLSDAFPQEVLPFLLATYGGAQMAETRMKVGEVLMRATRALGDLVFRHRDELIHAFLRGVRDPDSSLRASSLSNLGELCQILGFQLGPVVHELSSCLAAVVKTDSEAEVRRAAVHVVVLLLRGLSTKAVQVLRDVLLDLYRLLKLVVLREPDEVTVLHAQLALEELEDILRQSLFPPQTLQKRIEVLP